MLHHWYARKSLAFNTSNYNRPAVEWPNFEFWSTTLNHLGLFAKFWQPGTVKTRLAVSIGDLAASKVYRAFVFHSLNRHRDSANTRTVVFTPIEKKSDFRKTIPASWGLVPQSSGDLGFRMKSFFESQMKSRQESAAQENDDSVKIVIIGADCPQLETARLQMAFDKLDETPVVIGPSTDGGYYLLGMRNKCFDIFADIKWSTPTVFAATVGHLERQGIEYQTLPPLTDVDEFEDLLALQSELESCHSHNGLDQLDKELLERVQEATVLGPPAPVAESE